MRGPSVLVTGFEPFGGQAINPSELAVRALDGRIVDGHRVIGRVLPCVFGEAAAALRKELRALSPALVLCAGEAGGRAEIAVERVAINLDDARICDNAGARPIDRPIVPKGPAAYFATLPVKAIVSALCAAGIPAVVSHSAGTFVCNHVFYSLMRALARRPAVRGGFVHVPFVPEQAERASPRPPSMPLADIVRALEIAIATSLRTARDLPATGGAIY
ncbi:MAG TPA: pyroglutamyl-peptidase I [Sandaracinaceae bacterium]